MAALSGRQAALALISDLAWNSDLASMRRTTEDMIVEYIVSSALRRMGYRGLDRQRQLRDRRPRNTP